MSDDESGHARRVLEQLAMYDEDDESDGDDETEGSE